MAKFSSYAFPLAFVAALGFGAYSCTSQDVVQSDTWVKSPGVTISVYKEIEMGKPYMTVLYENFGTDTVERIRYELYTVTKGKYDTLMKTIDPPKLLRPKDRHSVPRHIGEDTVTWDEAHVGQVWVVRNNK